MVSSFFLNCGALSGGVLLAVVRSQSLERKKKGEKGLVWLALFLNCRALSDGVLLAVVQIGHAVLRKEKKGGKRKKD